VDFSASQSHGNTSENTSIETKRPMISYQDDDDNESYNFDNDESIDSYDFYDEYKERQRQLFTSYEEQQSEAIRQISTQFQDDDSEDTSKKEEAKDKDQQKEGSLWHITDNDELIQTICERIDTIYGTSRMQSIEAENNEHDEDQSEDEEPTEELIEALSGTRIQSIEHKKVPSDRTSDDESNDESMSTKSEFDSSCNHLLAVKRSTGGTQDPI
jgi:hypothetical protein